MKILAEDELKDFLESQERLAIYGIGGMGGNLYRYLQRQGWLDKLAFFLVTENPPEDFEGVPVKGIHGLLEAEKEVPVMIATRQNFHEDIIRSLEEEGVWDYHTMSEEVLNLIERLALEMPVVEEGAVRGGGNPRKKTKKALGRGLQSIRKLGDYLEALARQAENWLILIAARDTIGLSLQAEDNRRLMALGTRNLLQKHWRGYVFAAYRGKVLAEKLGAVEKSASQKLEVEGLSLELKSSPFHDGDTAVIRAGGHDYSMNMRGLNIVVLDLGTNQLVDSVNFDTHDARLTCSRSELYILREKAQEPALEKTESSFTGEGMSSYSHEEDARGLGRGSLPNSAPAGHMAVIFLNRVWKIVPRVLPGEKISFFPGPEKFPLELLLRGMARLMGLPVGETCRLAEEVCPDYSQVLTRGLPQAEEAAPETVACREALLALASRYEEEARRAGNDTVAASFAKIPDCPAENLTEALQWVRFTLAALSLAGHKKALLGRPDAYLSPWWQGEAEPGSLFKEFLLSLSRAGETPVLTLGGEGASPKVTGSILSLAEAGQLPPMVLFLRRSEDTPKDILELAEKCRGLHLVEDSKILPELLRRGCSSEEARAYVMSGSGEAVLPGKISCGRLAETVSLMEAVRKAKQGLTADMELSAAEDVLRDEVRLQVLDMLSYRAVHILASPLLPLFYLEQSQEQPAPFLVSYGNLQQAALAWPRLLRKKGLGEGDGTDWEDFLKTSVEEACRRYSMFDKTLLPAGRWQEVSHE